MIDRAHHDGGVIGIAMMTTDILGRRHLRVVGDAVLSAIFLLWLAANLIAFVFFTIIRISENETWTRFKFFLASRHRRKCIQRQIQHPAYPIRPRKKDRAHGHARRRSGDLGFTGFGGLAMLWPACRSRRGYSNAN
jgi:hypothetical protein